MMKSFRFSTFLVACASFAAFAGSVYAGDTAEIRFQGQSSEEVSLDTIKYRTEYQVRPVTRTCYRQEPRVILRCETYPNGQRRCWNEVVYGPSYPYPCTVFERVPVEIFDANVVANVKLSFGDLPEGMSANETFVVRLDDDSLKVVAKSSGRLLITQATPFITRTREGNTISVVGNYSYHFYNLAAISKVFQNGIANLTVKDGKTSFFLDSEFFAQGFRLGLEVSKSVFLGSDRVLFSRDLGPDLFSRTPAQNGRIFYSAAVKDLGAPEVVKGKVNFNLTGTFDTGRETIVNVHDLPNHGVLKAHVKVKPSDL